MATAQLVYSAQCPNCMRFLGALNRTPARASVTKIEVGALTPEQRRQVTAVPTLITASGSVLVGTKAFEWLKQFEGQMEVDSFSLGRGLPFSEIMDDEAAMSFATPYSAFEPVP